MNTKLNNQISRLIQETNNNPASKSRIKKLKKYLNLHSLDIQNLDSNILNGYRRWLEFQGYSQQTVHNDVSVAKKAISNMREDDFEMEGTSKSNRFTIPELEKGLIRQYLDQMQKNTQELHHIKSLLHTQALAT